MITSEFATSILVSKTPEEVFEAINRVPAWWSGNVEGSALHLGSEFTYTVPGVHYCKLKVVESVPGRHLVWLVTESLLSYARNKTEWTGTRIRFDIFRQGDRTQVDFTHEGLVPAFECFDECAKAWTILVEGQLFRLISTGLDQPNIFSPGAA
jgi:hypothetical protein